MSNLNELSTTLHTPVSLDIHIVELQRCQTNKEYTVLGGTTQLI